jgi:hypothetical protein
MTLSLLVPFRTDDGPRARAWEHARDVWETHLPEAELVVRDAGGERFHKAASFNLAASEANGDVFVLADADCIVDVDRVREAVSIGRPVIPFERICRLSRAATERVLDGEAPDPGGGKCGALGTPYALVLSREHYFAVKGLDERFVGWGGEDNAFAYALSTMVAPLLRLPGVAYHLWHPAQPKIGENGALFDRYRASRGDRAKMARLIGR